MSRGAADGTLPKSERPCYGVTYWPQSCIFAAEPTLPWGTQPRAIAAKKLYAHSERWTKEATQPRLLHGHPAMVLIQFGRWDDILLPRPPTEVPPRW
jgi:hypothetical protein